MKRSVTLIIDAIVNFILGILLLLFSPVTANFFGVPYAGSNFYPNILGAVFIGITIALLIEAFRNGDKGFTGLGLTGAISINLCGGTVLALWLLFGDLELPLKGVLFLWGLVLVLVVISGVELVLQIKNRRNQPRMNADERG